MLNVSQRTAGIHKHWRLSKTGSVLFMNQLPSSASYHIRTQTGYTGPRPLTKPMPPHAYGLNIQQIAAVHEAAYVYTNGESEFASGPGLSASGVYGATFLPTYDWSPLEAQALEKLNNNTRGSLDLSVDIAEAGKTAKMLRVKDQVIDYTQTFIKRFGPIRAASKAWLTYQYGLRPLVSSIFGIADENIRVVINKTQRFKARATGKFSPRQAQIQTIYGLVTFTAQPGSFLKTSVSYGVDLYQDGFDLARWSSLNPVSIAWELLPASFVVDWFVNVGGYLRSMETALLYANKFRSGYKTRFVAGNVEAVFVNGTLQPGEVSRFDTWTSNVTMMDISRTVLTQYPVPALPSFNAQLGSSRLLSGAALLGTLLGRR